MRGNGSVWTRTRRRIGLEENPLKRSSDRLQTRARVVCFVVFLLGCVAAVFVGHAAYEQETARAHLDERNGYQAKARVVSTAVSAADPQSGATQRVLNVVWTDPQGGQHKQRLVLSDGRRAQQSVKVWVDSNDRASMRRPPSDRAVASGIGAGMLSVFAVTFLLLCWYGLVVIALDRRRMKAWQREWKLVEPEWRRRAL